MNKYQISLIFYFLFLTTTNLHTMKKTKRRKNDLIKPLYCREYDIQKFKLGKEKKIEGISVYKDVFGGEIFDKILNTVTNDFTEKEKIYAFRCARRKSVKEVIEKLQKKYPIKFSKGSSPEELLQAYKNICLMQSYILSKEKIPTEYTANIVANGLEVYNRKNKNYLEKMFNRCKKLSLEELLERVVESEKRIKKDLEQIKEKENQCNEFKLARLILEALEKHYTEMQKKDPEEQQTLVV